MKSPRLEVRAGTAALGCPAERSSATASAQSSLEIASATLGKRRHPHFVPILVFALTILALVLLYPALPARAQQQSPAQPPQQASEDKKQADEPPKGLAGELVKETREAAGEDLEENASLKHAKPVQWLARKIDWSVHGTHLLLSGLNFAIMAVVLFWAARKFLPSLFRNRTAAIQQALQEARTASQDANRRLAEIENRLRQLDVEIGRMQSNAESEAAAEEARIHKAAEDDVRKVVLAAEQEIAAAAKQARRELSNHTASLALALASKQIQVDSNTDQVLVRTFTAKLAANNNDGGKDGQ
jgi:F-type H+-transporting ATPase subunit b